MAVLRFFLGVLCIFFVSAWSRASPLPLNPARALSWFHVKSLVRSQYEPLTKTRPWMGVSVGVIRGHDVRFYNFGWARTGERSTKHTVYTINSMTKTFVGTALAEEVLEGRAKLTEPVQDFLPGKIIPHGPYRDIELVDLATYTSGLPTVPGNLLHPETPDPYRDYTDMLFFDYLEHFHFTSDEQIGTTYLYSNLGFGLLGYALAQRDGTTFSDMIMGRVIGPMGLVETSADEDHPSVGLPLATGHDVKGSVQDPRGGPETMAGSWAIFSTTADMCRYLRAYLAQDNAASLNPALDLAQASTGRAAGRGLTSGLGWFVQTSSGDRFKDGAGGGFSSIMFFNRRLRTGLVVLANVQDDGSLGIENRAWTIVNGLR